MSDEIEINSLRVYKRLLKYLVSYKSMFTFAIIGNVIFALTQIAFFKSLEPLLDEGLVGGDTSMMRMAPFYLLAIIFARGFAGFIATYCMAWVGQQVVQKMRQELIDNYLQLPSQFFDQNNSGQLISKVTFNTQQVAAASSDALSKMLREGGTIVGLVIYLFYTNWQLAVIFFIAAPIIGILVGYAGKRFKKIGKNIQAAMGGVTQTTQEIVEGYKVIKTFGAEEFESKRFALTANRNRLQTMKMTLTKAVSTPLIQFIATFAIAGVIFYASYLLESGELTSGQFVAMLAAMMAILGPLKSISELNNVIQQGLIAAASVFDIVDSAKEKDKGGLELNEIPEKISIDSVSFSYPSSDAKVIKNISFEIPKGLTVALVGRSGSGKSTITNLLLRFYELDSGNIKFDDKDIQEYSLKSLRRNIAYVSQQVVLFDDSVRANIAYADDYVDEERLVSAARQAHALEFIEKMPSGFDSNIGENGSNLSGGQRQRLAIARAIYKNASIIILDEATSALDTESERHIQAALDALTENRTTLVIAHRLSTIENADNIVVMDEGEIVEQGDHNSLLKLNGNYAKLHSIQFSEE